MKRFSFSGSSGSLIYPSEEKNMVYSSEFQAMLDGLEDDESAEENVGMNGKKRRLSVDQVHALEKVFEVDNKLDPERKVKIAQELGLQPRQVSIWFQNRRARYKTKQLEKDYIVLKANFETLQLNYVKIEKENEVLIAELKGLKEKVVEENKESNDSDGKETCLILSPQNHQYSDPRRNCGVYNGIQFMSSSSETKELKEFNKDGSSDDSDSSGVMNNEDYNCSFNFQSLMAKSSSSSIYKPQFVRVEDQIGGFNTEDSCNIFSLDQAPNLYCYFGDYRN